MSTESNRMLLKHHLEKLRLPTIRREWESVAASCAKDRRDYGDFLLGLTERELIEREQRAAQRRIKSAKFPVLKTLEGFDFDAQPSINETLVRQLVSGEYLEARENVLLIGNSGTGKSHLASSLGFAACAQGKRVRFWSATALVTHMLEMREQRDLKRFFAQVDKHDLIVLVDNYDSFVYNLAHYVGELGRERRVLRNDAVTVDALLSAAPSGYVHAAPPL